jgi:hypothetical protein
MTNINGKTYAMNAVTPMPPWMTPILRLVFFVARMFQQHAERLHYDYLLFFSNFNGTWNQYIDAFSAVLSSGLDAIWLWSKKFPGAVPVTPFKQYITRVQVDTDYYYTAYPHATTNDVKAAHRVQAAFDAFAVSSASLPPEHFARAYRKFLVQVQGDLGTTGPAPAGT